MEEAKYFSCPSAQIGHKLLKLNEPDTMDQEI